MNETYRAILQQKRAELESRLRPSASVRQGLEIEHHADELDNVTARQDREMAQGDIERMTAILVRVKRALARLDEDVYGVCSSCEEEIPPARLRAIPWAERCVQCQESADIINREAQAVATLED